MALPTSYTEVQLSDYMCSLVTGIGPSDTWTDYTETINDVLLMYGVDDIANATDIQKLRAIAAYAIWQRLDRVMTGWYDFSADGGSYKRSQMRDAVKTQLDEARADAAQYLDDASAENTFFVGSMTFTDYYTPDANS